MIFAKQIKAPRIFMRLALSAALVALLIPTVACTSGPQLDPQLELSAEATERLEPLTVTGLGGKSLIWLDRIQYGPYRVEDVDRGWTQRQGHFFTIGGKPWNLVFRDWKPFALEGPHWSWQFGAWDGRPDWVSDYAFDLSENGEPAWQGQCGVELSAHRESMSCALRRISDGKVWVLALADVDAVPVADWLPPFVAQPQMAGYLADEETSLQVIENIGRPQGIPVSLEMGYSISQDGRTIAALDQLSQPAKMWLPRQDDDELRGVLAAGSAALYLYRGLREDVQKRLQKRL